MTTVDASELLQYSRHLGAVAKELLPQVRQVVQKTAQDIKADAQQLAPVDTGYLEGSITYETRQLSTSVVAEIGPTAAYGAFVEYGTTRTAPQPYMTPAAERRLPLLDQAITQLMERLL